MLRDRGVNARLAKCLKCESSSSRFQPGEGPALVGAFSVITNLRMELFEALMFTCEILEVSITCIAISFSPLSFSMKNLHFISSLICSATWWLVWPRSP